MNQREILNLAHRGFSGKYVENTLEAIAKALEVGADGFECDLRSTRDDVIVLFHDDDLKRLCNEKGSIENLDWKEVQNLRLKDGQRICRLEEVLDGFPEAIANFEIKASSLALRLVEKLPALFKAYPVSTKRMISSFSEDILMAVLSQKFHEEIQVSPIFNHASDAILKNKKIRNAAASWNMNFKNIRELKTLDPKEQTPPLWVWTPNQIQEWKALLESSLPIQAFITNYPDQVRTYLNSFLK